MVSKGDLLFRIDPEPYQLEVDRLAAVITSAEGELSAAESDFKRAEDLVKKQAMSQVDFEDRVNRRTAAEGKLAEAKSAHAKAVWELGQTDIAAPFAGMVSMSAVSIGDLISANTQEALATIVSVDPMEVSFDLNERDLIGYRKRTAENPDNDEREHVQVRLELPDESEYSEIGSITFVDNRVNKLTGTIQLRATFPNTGGVLVPGLYVTAILSRDESSEIIAVPQRCVLEDQQGKYVFVVDEKNMVRQARITVGQKFETDMEVKSGLEPGDKVVIEGIQKVRNGIEVTTTEATPSAPSAVEAASDDVDADEWRSRRRQWRS